MCVHGRGQLLVKPTYLATEYLHALDNEPRFLPSELGEERYETRRVEVFRDGRVARILDEMALSDQPAPSVEEINATPDGELRAREMGAAEFEELWSSRSPE